MKRWGAAAFVAFVGSIVLANWLIRHYGFVPVGFGLTAPAGTYAAGLVFVARDGDQLAACDVLFIGGDTEWKLTTGLQIAALARQAGKATHMGRVNSQDRYRLACAHLIDSADGTFLAFGPDKNIRRVARWYDAGAQLEMAT